MSADEVVGKVWGKVRWVLPRGVRRRLAGRRRRVELERLARDRRWARLDRGARETQFGQRWEEAPVIGARPPGINNDEKQPAEDREAAEGERERAERGKGRVKRWVER